MMEVYVLRIPARLNAVSHPYHGALDRLSAQRQPPALTAPLPPTASSKTKGTLPLRQAAHPPNAARGQLRRDIEMTGVTYNTQDPAYRELPYKFAGAAGQIGKVRNIGCTMTAICNAINITTRGAVHINPKDANDRNDVGNDGKFDDALTKVRFTNLLDRGSTIRGAPDPIGERGRRIKLEDSRGNPTTEGQALLGTIADAVCAGNVVILGVHHVDNRNRHTIVVVGYDKATNELIVRDNWQPDSARNANGQYGARRMKLSDALALYGERRLPTDPPNKKYRLAEIDLAVVVTPRSK
jgi:hypothetical protein